MKKLLLILLILSLSVSLLACGETAKSGDQDSVTGADNSITVSESDLSQTDDGNDSAPLENASVDNERIFSQYSEFIKSNYDDIMELCYGTISGIGFIDLDGDGAIEMVLFDGGASAAMGIVLFDIVEENIELISALESFESESYGKNYFSNIFISANFFEDFRRMKSVDTEDEFFLLESGNGSMEFVYRDLIRFSRGKKNELTLEALSHRQENYDPETGDPTTAEYSLAGVECDKAQYDKASSEFYSGCYDTGYDAAGVFLWEDPSAGPDISADKLSSMANEAFDRFKNSTEE